MAARLNLKGLKSPGHSVDPVIRKKVLTGGCRTPALKTDRTCFQYFRFCFVPGSEIYRSRKKHLFFRFERIFFVLGDKFKTLKLRLQRKNEKYLLRFFSLKNLKCWNLTTVGKTTIIKDFLVYVMNKLYIKILVNVAHCILIRTHAKSLYWYIDKMVPSNGVFTEDSVKLKMVGS